MGLFGANYTKEGPGVDKNAPQKKRFFLFWDIYFRKFWKLVQLNLLYFPFLIPGMFGFGMLLFCGLNLFSLLLILISGAISGPATAGLTYVLRNFSREEHAFVFSDFKDNFKSNFKQSFLYSTGFTLACILICTAAWFYIQMASTQTFMLVPMVISLIIFVILQFMNFYMYIMIVTFSLSLRQMLKNAFIFAVLGVFTNILTLFIVGVLAVLLLLFFPLTVLFMVTFAFSTIWFIITFNAYPRIKKLMIDPYLASQAAENAAAPADEEERIFSDERLIPPGNEDDQ